MDRDRGGTGVKQNPLGGTPPQVSVGISNWFSTVAWIRIGTAGPTSNNNMIYALSEGIVVSAVPAPASLALLMGDLLLLNTQTKLYILSSRRLG